MIQREQVDLASLAAALADSFEGGKIHGDHWRGPSPLRPGSNSDAFAVNLETGLWFDHVTSAKGDAISLFAALRGLDCKCDFPGVLQAIGNEFPDVVRDSGDWSPRRPAAPKPPPVPVATWIEPGHLDATAAEALPEQSPRPSPTTPEALAAQYGLEWKDFLAGGAIYAKEGDDLDGGRAPFDGVAFFIRTPTEAPCWKPRSLARDAKGKRGKSLCPAGVDGAKGLIGAGDLDACRGKVLVFTGGEEKMLAIRKAGFLAVSTSAGEKAPCPEQVEMLRAAGPAEIIVAFDADKTGVEATGKAAGVLIEAGFRVRCLAWPASGPGAPRWRGWDVADVFQHEGPDVLRALLDAAPVATIPAAPEPEPEAEAQGPSTAAPMETAPPAEVAKAAEVRAPAPAPVPQPLFRTPPAGEPFPLDQFPPLMAGAARNAQETTQAPLAMCAACVLGVASLAVQPHFDVAIPTGGVRPTSIYLLTIGESGERKTTVDSLLMNAAREHEWHGADAYIAASREHKNDLAAYESARGRIIKSAGKKGEAPPARAEIAERLNDLGAEPIPPMGRVLTVSEPNFEGLVAAFRHRPALGLYNDEGGGFLGGLAMREDNRTRTITALSDLWDAKPVKRTRAGEGMTVLPGRRLAIHLMVQPRVATLLLDDGVSEDQGILGRFLCHHPASTQGGRDAFRTPASGAGLENFNRQLRQLLERELPLLPHTTAEGRGVAPVVLRLDDAAADCYRHACNQIEAKLLGQYREVRSLANKIPEHACRLAGVMTGFQNPDATTINADDFRRGLAVAMWFLGEAVRLKEGSYIAPELAEAERLRQWLSTWPEPRISHVEIYNLGPRSLRCKEAAQRAMAVLEDHGWTQKAGAGAVRGIHRRETFHIIKPG